MSAGSVRAYKQTVNREGMGQIVESACCDAVLDNPQCREVIDYLSREV